MTEMVEKVALAMFHAECEPHKAVTGYGDTFGWDDAMPTVRDRLLASARAAIEAMREPTEAMISAGKDADWVGEVESRAGFSIMPDNTPDWNSDDDQAVISRPGIWQAMIAAALE